MTLNALSLLCMPGVNRVEDHLVAFLASVAGRHADFLVVVRQLAREVHEASAHALIYTDLVEHHRAVVSNVIRVVVLSIVTLPVVPAHHLRFLSQDQSMLTPKSCV